MQSPLEQLSILKNHFCSKTLRQISLKLACLENILAGLLTYAQCKFRQINFIYCHPFQAQCATLEVFRTRLHVWGGGIKTDLFLSSCIAIFHSNHTYMVSNESCGLPLSVESIIVTLCCVILQWDSFEARQVYR